MNLKVLTSMIIGQWCPIPRTNDRRVIDSTMILSDTHTPSFWWIPLNHELGSSIWPCLSYGLSLIPKLFNCLLKGPFLILSLVSIYRIIFYRLDSQVFKSLTRSYLASRLVHQKLLMCLSHIYIFARILSSILMVPFLGGRVCNLKLIFCRHLPCPVFWERFFFIRL